MALLFIRGSRSPARDRRLKNPTDCQLTGSLDRYVEGRTTREGFLLSESGQTELRRTGRLGCEPPKTDSSENRVWELSFLSVEIAGGTSERCTEDDESIVTGGNGNLPSIISPLVFLTTRRHPPSLKFQVSISSSTACGLNTAWSGNKVTIVSLFRPPRDPPDKKHHAKHVEDDVRELIKSLPGLESLRLQTDDVEIQARKVIELFQCSNHPSSSFYRVRARSEKRLWRREQRGSKPLDDDLVLAGTFPSNQIVVLDGFVFPRRGTPNWSVQGTVVTEPEADW